MPDADKNRHFIGDIRRNVYLQYFNFKLLFSSLIVLKVVSDNTFR